MNIHQISFRLKRQIALFSGKLSAGLPKVVGRFIAEMVYGINARGSVRLSEIARALEEDIPLIKTINRLSDNLAREGLVNEIVDRVAAEGSARVKEETLLIIDPSDISKRYAKKMEYLLELVI